MKRLNDNYLSYKMTLSKLLKENNLTMMSKDYVVIDRIFNLLTENLNIGKIRGLILSTEIIKYGGDIENAKGEDNYNQIVNWYDSLDL